jgi:hypothetical protein
MSGLHYEHKAAWPGFCPICCNGFRAGTVIESLAAPLVPNPQHCSYYADRGAWLIHSQYAKRMHARSWAHKRPCAERLDRKYSAAEQIALAQMWRDELAAMKREAIRSSDRHAGRHPKRGRVTA